MSTKSATTSSDNKSLIYDTLKTLSARDELSQHDFFPGDDDDDVYAPESFSKFFGDVVSEEELQQVLEQSYLWGHS
nr:4029_t:CDS:2 [Entrophospora candida]CAG8487071.1 6684_t:CDS:2 [Entrophospora candida]